MNELWVIIWLAIAAPPAVLFVIAGVNSGYYALSESKADEVAAKGKAQASLVFLFVGVPLAMLWPLVLMAVMTFVPLRLMSIATKRVEGSSPTTKPDVDYNYIPRTNEVRNLWIETKRNGQPDDREDRAAEFDRWLGAVLAEHENWAVKASKSQVNLDGIEVRLDSADDTK